MLRHPHVRVALLSASVVLTALVGCKTSLPTPPAAPADAEQTLRQNGGQRNTLQPGATGAQATTVNAGQAPKIAGRAELVASAKSALSAEQAMAVTASAGGIFASSNGALTATIPPGALTQDAKVKIVPIPTAGMSNTGAYIPGISFTADLGGAQLTPGAAIMVTSRVDDQFVARTKAADPAFNADKYHLTQDGAGRWLLTMQIQGAAAQGKTAGYRLLDVSTTPAPAPSASASAVASAAPSPSATVAPTPSPTATPDPFQSLWLMEFGELPPPAIYDPNNADAAQPDANNFNLMDASGCSIPIWMVVHNESLGVWSCGSVAHNQICWDQRTPPRQDLITKTTWASDDQAFANKAAFGANVRFSYSFESWWSGVITTRGAADLAVQADGSANTFASQGTMVYATPYFTPGNASGAAKSVRVDSPQSMAFQVPNYSPRITFRIQNSDIPITATTTVKYKLDGADQTAVVDTTALKGQSSGDVAFFAPLTSDANTRYQKHALLLTGVAYAGNAEVSFKDLAPATAQTVRVNGRAGFTANVYSSAVK